jgi:DNA-binding protein YbaB
MTDHQAEAEQLLAEYRRSREQLAAVQRALATLSVSERSQDGAVTVTVGAQGTLTNLEIHDETYRYYRPRQLAETILWLAQEAARRASVQAARLIEPVLPPGVDPAALLAGTADLRADEILPDEIEPDEPFTSPRPLSDPLSDSQRHWYGDDELRDRGWMRPAHGGDGR